MASAIENMDPAFVAVQRLLEACKPWLTSPSWSDVELVVDALNEQPQRVTDALFPKILAQLREKDAKIVWMTLIVRLSSLLPSSFSKTSAGHRDWSFSRTSSRTWLTFSLIYERLKLRIIG